MCSAVVQLVERWSPKPDVGVSNTSRAAYDANVHQNYNVKPVTFCVPKGVYYENNSNFF